MALTADLNSTISNQTSLRSYPVDTSKTFFAGGLVQVGTGGLIRPLLGNSTNRCVGQLVRLSPDGLKADVREGDIELVNSATGAATQANLFAQVYGEDDNIVTTSSSSTPKIGILVGFSDAGNPIVRCTSAHCF